MESYNSTFPPSMPPRSSPKAHQLRIIGGRWRGRRMGFPSVPGIRPTPDRVRETLALAAKSITDPKMRASVEQELRDAGIEPAD